MDKMNPKYVQAQKEGKAPLEYIPLSVLNDMAWVLKHGADKYGIRNWRVDPILMSTYKGAILRHLRDWSDGKDLDPDSGKNHLYHIMACCAVVLDSAERGTAIDDRTIEESKGDNNNNDYEENVGVPQSNTHGFGNQLDLYLERGEGLPVSPEAYLFRRFDWGFGSGASGGSGSEAK